MLGSQGQIARLLLCKICLEYIPKLKVINNINVKKLIFNHKKKIKLGQDIVLATNRDTVLLKINPLTTSLQF